MKLPMLMRKPLERFLAAVSGLVSAVLGEVGFANLWPTRAGTGVGIFALLVLVAGLLVIATVSVHATAVEVGFKDMSFPGGVGVNEQVTAEKPESKLWFNDSFWWASMWSTAGNAYRIHKLDTSTQTWTDTGTAIDTRADTRADALWTGSKLYIVSHVFVLNNGQTAPAGQRGQLYRYSYNAGTDTYTLDSGYPVEVTLGKSETLVLDRDGNGTLWVTYVESQNVMVNHSLNGNDLTWGTPYVLPITEAQSLNLDDISSIVAYNGFVGIMWSNQALSPKKMLFASHANADSDQTWTSTIVFDGSGDDHIHLVALPAGDSAGKVLASVKLSGQQNLIRVFRCSTGSCGTSTDWSNTIVYDTNTGSPTRPILLLDTTNRDIYVFVRLNDASGNGLINYKQSDLDTISWPAGDGTTFIQSSADPNLNDPSGLKQAVTSSSDAVVIASDGGTKFYFHNLLDIPSVGPTATRTRTPTRTATSTRTSTITPGPSPTRTSTITPGPSPTPTNTSTSTVTQTPTASNTPTVTRTPTASRTPTATATSTSTTGATSTATDTPTTGPSPTPSDTPTPSNTPTTGPTSTPTRTATSPATATSTSAPGTIVTFNAQHDAYVKSASPGSNYGTATFLRLRGLAGDLFHAYLKFDVTGVSGPVLSARVRLFVYNGSNDGGEIRSVSNDYSSGGAWTETGITWNNAPALSGSALDSKGVVSDNTWVEYTVTSAVTGDGTFSFGLSNGSDDSLYANSDEASSNKPELVVEYQPAAATNTPTTAPSSTATNTPPPAASATPTSTRTPTNTPLPTSTVTNTPLPTDTPTAGPSPTATNTLIPTNTLTPSPTSQATNTPTNTPANTSTATRTSTATNTPASTATPSATAPPTATATATGSSTQTFTFAAPHDALVKSSAPNSNYGTATFLRLRSFTGDNQNTYLKFTVSGLTGSVISAKVRLFAYNGGPDGGSIRSVSNDYSSGGAWTETGITWNNAPALSGSPLDTVGTVGDNTWVEYNVTSAVTGNGTFSFGLSNGSDDSIYFNSDEASSNKPELVVVTSSSLDYLRATDRSGWSEPLRPAGWLESELPRRSMAPY